jgi:predicted HicB family RNase H-like nuclease
MANTKPKAKSGGKAKAQLNVLLSDELVRRVSSVAGASGKTLVQFVSEALDERTRGHKPDVQRIANREKSPKKWQ